MNQDYIDKAYEHAHEEKARGQNCVMVLFPTRTSPQSSCTEGGIFTRYSDEPNSLMSLAIDTLILVGDSDDDGWDAHGIRLAEEKMRVSTTPKIIYLNEEY